jgi:hypothetical protein
MAWIFLLVSLWIQSGWGRRGAPLLRQGLKSRSQNHQSDKVPEVLATAGYEHEAMLAVNASFLNSLPLKERQMTTECHNMMSVDKVIPGQSWGNLKKTGQNKWSHNNCDRINALSAITLEKTLDVPLCGVLLAKVPLLAFPSPYHHNHPCQYRLLTTNYSCFQTHLFSLACPLGLTYQSISSVQWNISSGSRLCARR